MSEALILESVNPQYDETLFIEFPETYKFRTCCVQILFWMSKRKQNFSTQHVLNLYFLGNSMNNLLSYCGLTNARMRASEKDLPVMLFQMLENIFVYQTYLLNVLSSIYLAIGRRISSFSWMYVAVLRMIFHSFKMYFELQSLN